MKTTAKVLTFILCFMALAETSFAIGPRAFGKKGSATTTSAAITVPFHPVIFCIRNDDATNGLYYDWSDGVASTVDESTNLYLPPGVGKCFTFLPNVSPMKSFVVGIRSSAATAEYHFDAMRAN